jgi:hypothetical protein
MHSDLITGHAQVLGSAILAFGLIPAASAICSPAVPEAERPAAVSERGGHLDPSSVSEMPLGRLHTVPPELYPGGLLLDLAPLAREWRHPLVIVVHGHGMAAARGLP